MDKLVNIDETPIKGVYTVSTDRFEDERGSFSRLFCSRELAPLLGERSIVQINHSCTSNKGTVRGLHYQSPPVPEMKLVRCLKGKIWDVAVDLRKGSPTFLKWHAVELSSRNNLLYVIPEGVAHGFQTLENDCELLYLHTEYYSPEYESGVSHLDGRLNIDWPLSITTTSDRDRKSPPINGDFKGIEI